MDNEKLKEEPPIIRRTEATPFYYNYKAAARQAIKIREIADVDDKNRTGETGNANWQPLYHSKFSGGFVFQNELLPPYMNQIMFATGNIKNGSIEAIHLLHSALWAIFPCVAFLIAPVAQRRIHDALIYSDMLYEDWREYGDAMWPDTLAKLLCFISQDLQFNYHHAGLGIEYERQQSHRNKINESLGLR